jgi:hypothetical protein
VPRIPDGAGPGLSSLYQAAPSETTPILLELARQQAGRRRPADLLAQLERDRFVQPSSLDLRLVHQLDGLALMAASGFDAVLLSPVAPLGSCSVLGPSSQDRTLTTGRGQEVVSDPTNAMALLAAQQLRLRGEAVRLCTVHQTLRAQPLPPVPGFSRHFRLFALCEAGLAQADEGFEVEAILRMIGVFERLLEAAASGLSCRFPNRRAAVRTTPAREALGQRLVARLQASFPNLALAREPLEHPYYDGVRVAFGADSRTGEHVPAGDIGAFDWVAKLTANRRHRFVAAGFGLQLLPLLFR